MGCDCRVMLPQNVRCGDVADVCGMLLGLEKWKMELSGGSWSVRVRGVSFSTMQSIPGMVAIHLQGCTIGEPIRQLFFHYETDGDFFSLGGFRSRAVSIAMSRKLIRFFGGVVDANDCDDNERDFEWKFQSRKHNSPQDGKEWDDFQQRKWNVKPLTKAEINRCEKLAAYKEGE